MRKLAITLALASTAIATPAAGRDGSAYVGVEGGILYVDDMEFDVEQTGFTFAPDLVRVDHNRGLDLDLVAGYDLGMFRVEGELGWKRASVDRVELLGFGALPVDSDEEVAGFEGDGKVRILSGMLNGLVDMGDEDGFSGYLGGGVGIASVRYDAIGDVPVDPDIPTVTDVVIDDTDRALAWQLIAGVRYALSPNIDVGLKYRFFNTRRLEFGDEDTRLEDKFRSHSLLASLIFNFGAAAEPLPPPPPPPPPPPAPPPPATQTCPDGTVILATEICPAPPPPPPPPPPAPERG